jgi:hypothetical protein
MAEPSAEPSPEEQLFARLKLQRVVFGAFAIVLVCLFAVGLSAYRKMQSDRDAAIDAKHVETMAAAAAQEDRDKTERDLQAEKGRLGEARRELALSKCRLAVHEIRTGNPARAEALLAKARELGPPAWWPLVAHFSREQAVRFEGSDSSASPVIAGDASADMRFVAIAREVVAGVQVEIYGARDGRLVAAYPPQTPGPNPGARLLLNADGTAWYLALAGRAYYGTGGVVSVVPSGPIAGWDPQAPLDVAADPGLSIVYEAHGERGLVRRSRIEQGWTTEIVALDPAPRVVNAVCVTGAGAVIATDTGILAVDPQGRTRALHEFATVPGAVALKAGPGVTYAAVLNDRDCELLALGDSLLATSRHTMPDEPFAELRFLCDDTPVWLGVAGRAVTMDFQTTQEWSLGGRLSFIERHVSGLVFANRRGEFSVRTQAEFAFTGVPQHLLAPGVEADAQAHGFLLKGEQTAFIAVQRAGVSMLPQAKRVVLTPKGPAWFEEFLMLPGGVASREAGSLLAGFADGSVLLFHGQQKLKHVSATGVNEILLPEQRVPDVVTAAAAPVAALRVSDTVYVWTTHGALEPVASRMQVAPDLTALDAAGKTVAIAYGATIVVRDLRANVERTVAAAQPPRRIALLFGGSVLATIESGQLVLYEVDGGRELMRAGDGVADLDASSDSALNVVAAGRLCELSFD